MGSHWSCVAGRHSAQGTREDIARPDGQARRICHTQFIASQLQQRERSPSLDPELLARHELGGTRCKSCTFAAECSAPKRSLFRSLDPLPIIVSHLFPVLHDAGSRERVRSGRTEDKYTRETKGCFTSESLVLSLGT
jgi:hypothetical protein